MAEDMEFLPRNQILSIRELELIASTFIDLGVRKIRLTGGEPTIREGIIDLAANLAKADGLDELAMTTNGVLLDRLAKPLAEAGVTRLNVSIDSLKPERFKQLSRFGALDKVLKGIDSACNAGFKNLKLNVVILNGVNTDEILDLATYAIKRNIDISFIEEMPLGNISSHKRANTLVTSKYIKEHLEKKYTLTPTTETTGGPSRYFQVYDKQSKVGFISPISDNFCSTCNRVRVTVEGQLLLCLGNEHSIDLRSIIRSKDFTQDKLRTAIISAISRKPEKHYFDPENTQIVRFMSATGG